MDAVRTNATHKDRDERDAITSENVLFSGRIKRQRTEVMTSFSVSDAFGGKSEIQ